MGTFITILILLILAFLALWVKANNNVKANDWKQEQNNELKTMGIINSVEYYYAYDTLAYTARYIVDNVNKKIAIYTSTSGFVRNKIKVIDFNDLLGVEIFVDSQKCGGIKRAVVGELLAGGDGAVVDALTAKRKSQILKLFSMPKR